MVTPDKNTAIAEENTATMERDGSMTSQDLTIVRDKDVRQNLVHAVDFVASLVRSNFGPYGMESLIETTDPRDIPEVVHTDRGSEVLDAIQRGDGFNHPVSALLVDNIDSMQRQLSDGTTAALILANALVENGVDLLEEGFHPGTLMIGYGVATARAGETLDALSEPLSVDDDARLRQVARSSMTTQLPTATRSRYATLICDAVQRLSQGADNGWLNTDEIKILTTRALATESLFPGIVIQQHPYGIDTIDDEAVGAKSALPLSIEDPIDDPTIALIDRKIDLGENAVQLGKAENAVSNSKIQIDSAERLKTYRSEKERVINDEATRLRELGVDVLLSQPRVDPPLRRAYQEHGLSVVDNVQKPKADVYRLARATGGSVVANLADVTEDDLGSADRIGQRYVEDERWTYVARQSGGVSTMLLGVNNRSGAVQRKQVVSDAVNVSAISVMDESVIPGAGAAPMAVAMDLRSYAKTSSSREQLAMEAFADAIEQLPVALVENAGLDPIKTISSLRTAHAETDDPSSIGVKLPSGDTVDAWEYGVIEPRRIFSQAIETARSTVEQLLPVDTMFLETGAVDDFAPNTEHD